jgi:hypothetical protein
VTRIQSLALFVAFLLPGCATPGGEYPSLAQREAERATGTFTPDTAEAAPAPPPVPSADLAQRLAALQREVQAAHAEFIRTAPTAERLAAAASGPPSDSWAAAQVALADLDSLRSRAAIALAELDILWADANVESGPREAVGPVRSAVEALIAEEDAVLARLRGRL